MALRTKYKAGDKVIYRDFPATVVETHPRKLIVRDAWGWLVPVKRKEVRPA